MPSSAILLKDFFRDRPPLPPPLFVSAACPGPPAQGGLLDRDEVLSAASALAAVPFSSRQAVATAERLRDGELKRLLLAVSSGATSSLGFHSEVFEVFHSQTV